MKKATGNMNNESHSPPAGRRSSSLVGIIEHRVGGILNREPVGVIQNYLDRVRAVQLLLEAGTDADEGRREGEPLLIDRLADLTHRTLRLWMDGAPHLRDAVFDGISRLFDTVVKSGARLGRAGQTHNSFSRAHLCRLGWNADHRCCRLLVEMIRIGVDMRTLVALARGLTHLSDRDVTTESDVVARVELWKTSVCFTEHRAEPDLAAYARTLIGEPEQPNETAQHLADWLDADRRNAPSLHRQCRVVIRRRLAQANGFSSLAPLVERLTRPRYEPLRGRPSAVFERYLL